VVRFCIEGKEFTDWANEKGGNGVKPWLGRANAERTKKRGSKGELGRGKKKKMVDPSWGETSNRKAKWTELTMGSGLNNNIFSDLTRGVKKRSEPEIEKVSQ